MVHGCVGNRAAVLPLQLLGLETDVLNTFQYSINHVGYGSLPGEKLTGEQPWALLQGMHANGLLARRRTCSQGTWARSKPYNVYPLFE